MHPVTETQNSVRLGEIIKEFHLELLHEGEDYQNIPLRTLDVNRPGLPLSGFFEHFDTKRLLVMGLTETTYVSGMSEERRRESFDRLLSYPVPALIYTRGIDPFPECMEMAQKYGRTVLRTQEQTSAFMSSLIGSLYNHLAPRITRSGVMMEIYGEGVLFQGESGVGKSEVAIELIKRGHRIIADDAVEIRRVSAKSLVGSSPENIRHFMELRGVGIINARRLFGIGAVKMTEKINMIVQLEQWDAAKVYDRMGMNDEYTEVLGVQIPSLTIPVKPGRNLAIIIEVAAMNNRQKRMGYNAAQELLEKLGMVEPDGGNPTDWGDF